jgi:polyvinyl alcohol dehydrogenase (cytochrome)
MPTVLHVLWLLTALAVPLQAQQRPCPAPAGSAHAGWTRWGGDLSNSRFLPAAPRLLSQRQLSRLTASWAFSLGESMNARSQPVATGNTVYVGSENGQVHAIDLHSGCTRWSFKSEMAVRSGLVIGEAGGDTLIWFGDLAGTVHALDARTGTRRWKRRVDPHFAAIITGAPQLFRGVLYVPVSSYESALPLQPSFSCCTFRGSVVALDAQTGEQRWKTFTVTDTAAPSGRTASGTAQRGPSGAAIWSTPTIDSTLGRLYVGTGNNYSDPPSAMSDAIVAMELATGRIAWARQFTAGDAYNISCDIPGRPNCPSANGPDADFGQPPILITLPDGKRRLLAAQKSGDAHALDPDRDGTVVWSVKVSSGGRLGGAHWGSATDGRTWYVAIGGQEIVPVPDSTIKEKFRLEPDPVKGGGLVALDVVTGRERWRAAAPSCAAQSASGKRAPMARPKCSPAQSAPITVIGDLVVSGALDGIVRAYDARTGSVLWFHDTVRDYTAVNGGVARGGAIDAAGPVVIGETLLIMSGYGLYGGQPGNVLLAFRPRR